MSSGKVSQVIGTVVDVEFPAEEMPAIFNSVETKIGDQRLVLEVEQHIGNNRVTVSYTHLTLPTIYSV